MPPGRRVRGRPAGRRFAPPRRRPARSCAERGRRDSLTGGWPATCRSRVAASVRAASRSPRSRSARGGRSSACRASAASRCLRTRASSGINFLDDARYNDETGSAPIPTGYSEVLFGELFRAAGFAARGRDRLREAVVGVLAGASRAAGELDGSLGAAALRLRRSDLLHHAARGAERRAGRGRGRGAARGRKGARVGRRQLDRRRQIEAATLAARRAAGIEPPCAAQLPYSLVSRDWAESRADARRRCARAAPASSPPRCSRAGCSAASTTPARRRDGWPAHSTIPRTRRRARARAARSSRWRAEWETTRRGARGRVRARSPLARERARRRERARPARRGRGRRRAARELSDDDRARLRGLVG